MGAEMPAESFSMSNVTPADALRAPGGAEHTAIDPYPIQAEPSLIGGDSGPQFFLNADARAGVGPNGKPSDTIDQAASQLIRGEPGWSYALGVGVTVTYAYRADAPASMPDDSGGFQRFSAAQINQAEL